MFIYTCRLSKSMGPYVDIHINQAETGKRLLMEILRKCGLQIHVNITPNNSNRAFSPCRVHRHKSLWQTFVQSNGLNNE